MANTYRNVPIHGLTEILGGQSTGYKTCSGKTIHVNKPIFEGRSKFKKTKETLQNTLRRATTYANFERRQEIYINKARDKGLTPYGIAIADWFSVPRVLVVSVDAWTGKPGQTIRVKAKDNVQVASVSVVIRDAEGKVLETGEALPSKSGSTWWKYITKGYVRMPPFPRVEVTARDLAGNEDTFILC